jgi:hypothetical protein
LFSSMDMIKTPYSLSSMALVGQARAAAASFRRSPSPGVAVRSTGFGPTSRKTSGQARAQRPWPSQRS